MWKFGNSTVGGPVRKETLRSMAEIMSYQSLGRISVDEAMRKLNGQSMALDSSYMRPPLPQEGLAYGRASVGHHMQCPWPAKRFGG